MKPSQSKRPEFSQMEHEVLSFWDEHHVFEKSVMQRPVTKPYIFYDGPPFANGLPHYGHLLGSTSKDVIPRYFTMKGYRVERKWGWDCHGVPIENAIEKELGLTGGKKGIEKLGIDKFNQACRASIMAYDKEWKKTIRRLGRWVDFEHAYKTMDLSYMESVWWGFSQLHQKKLIYKGRKVVLYCPRCSTPLSNFEIAMDNSYKDVEDNSLYVKFRQKDNKETYFVAWTTTPWTLPGNVALAVLPQAEYVKIEHELTLQPGKITPEYYWVAKERVAHLAHLFQIKKAEIVETKLGKELEGIEYEPLYSYMPLDGKKAHYITTADFVSLEDGTGIVHTAAIFGEDDYALALQKDLPAVSTLDDQGKFLDFVTPLSGVFYKKAEDWVIDDLHTRGLLFHAEKITHSYPFCYRCSTPLYFNALPAWFIDVSTLKPKLIEKNEPIHWIPAHLKYGRFGKGLVSAPDWNISRSRYWGTPMPIWEEIPKGKPDPNTKLRYRVIGSLDELKKWAVDPKQVETLTDLHREFIDSIEVFIDDERTIKGKRIFEVFDCWVESASMPFAQIHYPFENKENFHLPAQFISEYIAQTRAWFYCMHVINVGIFDSHAFENCLTTGTILAEDGTKMSKSKKNYPDPSVLVEHYGSDALRLYLMSSTIMKAENLNFSEKGVHEIQNKVMNILWNIYSFYALYVPSEPAFEFTSISTIDTKKLHVLDRWILSRLSHVTSTVTQAMDQYDVFTATRALISFVDELSTWYVRESRSRLRQPKDTTSLKVLGYVLYTVCQLFAPHIPFITETIYQKLFELKKEKFFSIHLTNWPEVVVKHQDKKLEEQMDLVRRACEAALSQRKEKSIKVRQPLQTLTIQVSEKVDAGDLLDIIKAEVNVKEVVWQKKEGSDLHAMLDTTLTESLMQEGEAREVIRRLQDLRKEAGVQVNDYIHAWIEEFPDAFADLIREKTLAVTLQRGKARIEKV